MESRLICSLPGSICDLVNKSTTVWSKTRVYSLLSADVPATLRGPSSDVPLKGLGSCSEANAAGVAATSKAAAAVTDMSLYLKLEATLKPRCSLSKFAIAKNYKILLYANSNWRVIG